MGLVDELPGMAYRCRNDSDWTMEFVSAGAEELTGYAAAALTRNAQVAYGDLIHPDDRQRVWTEVQRGLQSGDRFQITYRIRTASGETKWVWEQGRGVFSDDGELEHLEGFISDVTEQRRAEERFRRVFESSPMGMYVCELEAGGRLVLRAANPAADRILGIEHGPLIGLPIEEAFPGLEEGELPDTFRALAAEGGTWHMGEVPYQQGAIDGVFDVQAFQTLPGQMAVMYQDITERKQNERQLRKLSMAVEQSAGSVMITGVDGTIEYVNAYYEQLTGYGREDVLGTKPRLLRIEEQDAAFYRELWETITSGGTWRGVLVNRKKDGTTYSEEQTVSPIYGDAGEIVNFVAVGRDITKELELEAQMRQAQRLESIGRLVGGIVHDFNNLLTAVTGYSQLLLRNENLDELAKRDLEQILGAANRAAALTRQLLAFSRKQTLELKVLSLNDVVEGLTKMLGRLVRADIQLVTRLEPDLWNLKADRAQLEQVLMNLVVNASDAMPDGGTLTIATETMALDERYAEMHLEVEPGRYVLLTVSDTGIGMDRKTASRVFEPFFTTKKEKGTGLGLSTVYGIVKQHGGHIWVYSEPGQGTTFKIYLPPVGGREETATAAEDRIEVLQGTETVLLVDDDEQIREPVRRTLEAFGYTVLESARPEEALQLAAAHDGQIHLLLTDVVMPGMSGNELAKRFAATHPQSTTLLMSGHTDDTPTLRAALLPGAAFLRKPFTATDLARKVREVLDAGAGGSLEVPSGPD